VEIVFHEAAIASVPRSVVDPITSNDSNVSGTLQLLVAARDAKVRRVVYAGSSSAYGEAPSLPKHEGMLLDPISRRASSETQVNSR
jgi:UDP-glucose 4-epimerase